MWFFIIIDYIVALICLIVYKAPWWAWLLFVGSILLWLGIFTLCSGGIGSGTTDKKKDKEP